MQGNQTSHRSGFPGRHVVLFFSLDADIDPLFRLLAPQCSGITLFVERENDACRAELLAHGCDVRDFILFHVDPNWRASPDFIREVLSTPAPRNVIACQNRTSSLNALQSRLCEAGFFSSDQIVKPCDFERSFLGKLAPGGDQLLPRKGRICLRNLRSLSRRKDHRNPLRSILIRDTFHAPDLGRLASFLTGKTLTLFGGASSVGRALMRFLISQRVPLERVVVINPPGNNLNLLKDQLSDTRPPFDVVRIERSVLDNHVYDTVRLDEWGQPIAVQLAGVKYHHHATRNPWEAFNVNAYATARIMDFVRSSGATALHPGGYFLFTSSDKATDLRPINVLGLTRKLAEYYILSQVAPHRGPAINVGVTRFTHILNSTGSWLFQKLSVQRSCDKPYTLTDERAYTSFIRLDEAVTQLVDTLRLLLDHEFLISTPARVGKPVLIKDVIQYENSFRANPRTTVIGLREGEHIGSKDLKSSFSKGAFLNEFEKADAAHFHMDGTLVYSTRPVPIPHDFMRRAINFLQIELPRLHDCYEARTLIDSVIQLINAKFIVPTEHASTSRALEELCARIGDCSLWFHRRN